MADGGSGDDDIFFFRWSTEKFRCLAVSRFASPPPDPSEWFLCCERDYQTRRIPPSPLVRRCGRRNCFERPCSTDASPGHSAVCPIAPVVFLLTTKRPTRNGKNLYDNKGLASARCFRIHVCAQPASSLSMTKGHSAYSSSSCSYCPGRGLWSPSEAGLASPESFSKLSAVLPIALLSNKASDSGGVRSSHPA